jgi:hypothetical protein
MEIIRGIGLLIGLILIILCCYVATKPAIRYAQFEAYKKNEENKRKSP